MPPKEKRAEIIDLPGSKPDRLNQVEISIMNRGSVNVLALVNYIMERKIELDPMGNKDIEPGLKWLNAVYRQDPASRWVTRPNANAYYDRAPGTFMPLRSTADVLEAIRGIYQTVQIRFGKLTVNVDTATTAFWTPNKSLIESVHVLMGLPLGRDVEQHFLRDPPKFFAQCERLVGIYFNVRHLSERRNSCKIKLNKWSKGSALDLEFQIDTETGKEKTNVNEYVCKALPRLLVFCLRVAVTIKRNTISACAIQDCLWLTQKMAGSRSSFAGHYL